MSQNNTALPAPLLARALNRHNLSFTTYAILEALGHARKSIVRLADETGLSYYAVRQQIIRTPYFTTHHDAPLITVQLNPEARTILHQIQNLIQNA